MLLMRSLRFVLAGACSRRLRSAVVPFTLTVSLPPVSSSLLLSQNLDASSVFAEDPSYPVSGIQATSVALADVNRDGKPALIVTNARLGSTCYSGRVAVLLGNGCGSPAYAISGVADPDFKSRA